MINYPNGRKPMETGQRSVEFGRRGMELEKEINRTNQFYLSRDIAVIHKKPTPVTIVKVDYPKRSAAKITEAYFKLPSTTDYNGIYKGRYIDFEAKDNQLLTSFPLKSIHPHQIRHLDGPPRWLLWNNEEREDVRFRLAAVPRNLWSSHGRFSWAAGPLPRFSVYVPDEEYPGHDWELVVRYGDLQQLQFTDASPDATSAN